MKKMGERKKGLPTCVLRAGNISFEIDCCERHQDHANHAFDVIWRKQLTGWVYGSQDGISKQKYTESYNY